MSARQSVNRRRFTGGHLQNAYEPAMIPLAAGVGKRMYARRVKGIESAANNTGGMTRRSLTILSVMNYFRMKVKITYPWERSDECRATGNAARWRHYGLVATHRCGRGIDACRIPVSSIWHYRAGNRGSSSSVHLQAQW